MSKNESIMQQNLAVSTNSGDPYWLMVLSTVELSTCAGQFIIVYYIWDYIWNHIYVYALADWLVSVTKNPLSWEAN